MRVLVTGGSGFIGTNLVEYLRQAGHSVLSIDCKPPQDARHADLYAQADLLKLDRCSQLIKRFAPLQVVHLAARTDLVEGEVEREYAANTAGTRNLVAALKSIPSVQRCIFTSSKFVCPNGYWPADPGEYRPDTLYGQSKAAMERELQAMGATPYDWCIVRPTSIWGPWFGVPYRDFFLAIARRRYFHLGRQDPPRSFGYVGNIVHQLVKLLEAPNTVIRHRVFYLSDYESCSIRTWAEMIGRQLGRSAISTLPEGLVQPAALIGDMLKRCGWKNPPITTFRLANMRANTSGAPTVPIQDVAGPLPYTIEQGVDETINWLRSRHLI